MNDYIANGKWNCQKLAMFLDQDIVKSIKGILIPLWDLKKEFIWGSADNERFSIILATWLQYCDDVRWSLWVMPIPGFLTNYGIWIYQEGDFLLLLLISLLLMITKVLLIGLSLFLGESFMILVWKNASDLLASLGSQKQPHFQTSHCASYQDYSFL